MAKPFIHLAAVRIMKMLLMTMIFLFVTAHAFADPPVRKVSSKYESDPFIHAVAEAIQGISGSTVKGQFTSNELKYLSSVLFVSSPAIVDYSYQDRIINVGECKILRTATNFAGVQSSPKPVTLDPDEFWSRIAVLAEYRKKVGMFPPSNTVNEDILRSGIDYYEQSKKQH